ncbi:hypothetical protein EON80_27035 [bacterium]|nr:MAG: hypothetical protein EON80_27035 [bacterium]
MRSYSGAINVFGVLGGAPATPPKTLAAIPATSLTVMLGHRTNGNGSNGNLSSSIWNNYADLGNLGSDIQFVHLDTAPFLYADGHVKSIHGVTGKEYPTFPGYTTQANGSADCLYTAPLPQG